MGLSFDSLINTKALTQILLLIFFIEQTSCTRLNKLFQFIDGYRSEHTLRGYLHVGKDYAVFLNTPQPHAKFLTYELYAAGRAHELTYKPILLAVSKVPVEYIRKQLKKFREELFRAKYVDDNVVPGTEVQTLREWQISRAINFHGGDSFMLNERPYVLRTVI